VGIAPRIARGKAGARALPRLHLILGKYDYNTPTPLAAEYFASIDAPMKRLVILDRSAHMPMLETPAAFATALHTVLAPLTSLQHRSYQ